MKDSEFREQDLPKTYDNTMLAHFTTCPRQYYWFMRGLDYVYPPAYFTWGRAWGAGLNAWYETIGNASERASAALKVARKVWEEDSPFVPEKSNDTWENLERTFLTYVENNISEPWEQKSGHGELGFEFPIPGTPWFYGGALDAYIEWLPYGMLIREDKTTGGYLTETYMSSWDHASQVTGYIWALGQLLGEEPFGALMNLASKRPRKDDNLRFSRNLIKKTQWQLDEFMHDTVLIIEDIQREHERWNWPKTGERKYLECSGGPGKSSCLYKNLCLQQMEPWKLEKTYDFSMEFIWRESSWAPWKRKGEG